ncbi:polyphenol oxidase family protein [Kineosporia sp. A_224]|uniref:polyphenol oxidase family protein n=1 Tax=Kineosporia sp. A_224 TaxID=1962180 RepID=UPI000B4B0FDB|nr:polyphenol oxidase family protein [Kineosporia sp. A_224]
MDSGVGTATGASAGPVADVVAVDLGPGVRAGFTRRPGGVSRGPWAGLDLGLHVGDDPDHVLENRRLVERWAGMPVWYPRQVHGREVAVLDAPPEPGRALASGADGAECDAAVAVGRGHAVAVVVADCVPVLLADPAAGVVAAAHAGRPGLLAGVLESTVEAMVARGAVPASIRVALGPSAGPCCYEVPEQMRDDAAARVPETAATTRAGTPAIDLRAGCAAVLRRAGVGSVRTVGGCTIDDESFYSYRRAKVTGRCGGVVGIAP